MNKKQLTLVQRWQSGLMTADEAMKELAKSLEVKKPATKRPKKEIDVSGFLRMADAIVQSRKKA